MSSKKNIKRKSLVQNPIPEPLPLEVSIDVQNQIKKLQMEVDILKETINVLKKTPALT